jgi:hypothetical protein
MKLVNLHDMSAKIVHASLHKDLLLSKKLASWVTKWLEEELKKDD